MATQYRFTGASYDQPRVDPDEWVALGRPAGAYPTKTVTTGEVIEFRNAEEKERLLGLGVVEEVPAGQSSEEQAAQIEQRRRALESESGPSDDDRTVEELRAEAEARGLPKSGTKAELQKRLAAPDPQE